MRFKVFAAILTSLFLNACGSMSFGATMLNTLSVFGEANAIKQCYDAGGDHAMCEGGY